MISSLVAEPITVALVGLGGVVLGAGIICAFFCHKHDDAPPPGNNPTSLENIKG